MIGSATCMQAGHRHECGSVPCK